MQLGKEEPIHWCTGKGAVGNPMQLKRKGISPNGVVAEISMANGKAITNRMGNMYFQLQEYSKPLRGWVWYHECSECPDVPQAEKLALEGKTFADLELCEECMKRENLIAVRAAAKTKSTKEYVADFETSADKLTDVLALIAKREGFTTPPVLTPEMIAEHMPKVKGPKGSRLRTDKEVAADAKS